MTTIKEMVAIYLTDHDYDGLCSIENECWCSVDDDDFMPCHCPYCEACVAAKYSIDDDLYYPVEEEGKEDE